MPFNKRTALSYNVRIISFDEDYYYGQFYRVYEGNLKRFLSNFKLDLDNGVASVFLDRDNNLDRQAFDDFGVEFPDDKDLLRDQINERISEALQPSVTTIFQVIKQEGGTIEFIIRGDATGQ